jgi:RNA polymerase sigma-B factor
MDLYREYRLTRDPRLRESMVNMHVGLARGLARRFAGRGEELDDLVQVAFVGLLHAIDRFDPDYGRPFEAFASITILGELKHHFRDRRWLIRVPRPVQDNYLRVRAAMDVFSQDLGRSPATSDVADYTGLSEPEVLDALNAGRSFRQVSLNGAGLGGSPWVQDLLARPCPELQSVEDRELAASFLTRLPQREQQIVWLRFGQQLSQREIAERVGTSQMHVSRLLARSLDTLRSLAESPDPDQRKPPQTGRAA